jgi:DNA-binding NarL/FixJ family response regulator
VTRVLLVDDQPLVRAGVRAVLESAGIEVVAEAAEGAEALHRAREAKPDVVVMDLRMPRMDGVEATRLLRADPSLSGVRVLVLTTFDGDENVLHAVRAGADGFLSKTAEPDELIDAVERAARGEAALSSAASRAVLAHIVRETPPSVDPELVAVVQTLTPRERDLVIAAATGASNDDIARRLSLSPLTVKTHLNRAMAKVGARDRGQLVAVAYLSGLAR